MTDKVKLAENVVLVDVAYFNSVIEDMKAYFENRLGRKLQDIYTEEWLSYLLLDAGIREGNNEIDVLFVHDAQMDKLSFCNPANLQKELNGVGYNNLLGEFSFTAVSSEGLTSRENLYLDLLTLAVNSADVRQLLLVPFYEIYGDKLRPVLREYGEEPDSKINKVITLFSMDQPTRTFGYQWDLLGYSLMRALGIKADDLE